MDDMAGNESSHSAALFVGENGGPMYFYMAPCQEKSKLRPLIQVDFILGSKGWGMLGRSCGRVGRVQCCGGGGTIMIIMSLSLRLSLILSLVSVDLPSLPIKRNIFQ